MYAIAISVHVSMVESALVGVAEFMWALPSQNTSAWCSICTILYVSNVLRTCIILCAG